jgi:hypothetical protein
MNVRGQCHSLVAPPLWEAAQSTHCNILYITHSYLVPRSRSVFTWGLKTKPFPADKCATCTSPQSPISDVEHKFDESVDFTVFWRWYMAHRITGSLDFFHRPVFLGVESRRFGNWLSFRLQVKGGTRDQLFLRGPIEVFPPFHLRTEEDPISESSCLYSQEHRTMGKVQNPSSYWWVYSKQFSPLISLFKTKYFPKRCSYPFKHLPLAKLHFQPTDIRPLKYISGDRFQTDNGY